MLDTCIAPAATRARRFLPETWVTIGLLFLLGLTPLLRSSGAYHGDERFYTDAALMMERTGELVPRYADGAPRLNKPLLAYVLIVASHATLGVGLLQSRLPFAAAGALLVMLAGSLAQRLLADRRAGTLAALILASNPDVLTLSSRSTPDILVCASALLALGGAARVLLEGEARSRGAYEFWIGAGLATAAKGLWGLLLVAFVLLGACTRPALRAHVRRLCRLLPIGLGLALAACGVAPLFAAGTSAVLAQATTDQLRASLSLAVVLHNLGEYLPALAVHLLPWSALLSLALFTRAGRRAAADALRTPIGRVALAWWVVLALVFLPSSARRVRYLAPALAPLALALSGALLALARDGRGARVLRGTCAAVSALGSLALLACALLLARWRALAALELALLALACGALAWLLLRRASDTAPLAFGWSAFALAIAYCGVLRPTLVHSPLPEIVARLEGEAAPASLGVAGLEDSISARLRLLSAGRLEPRALDASTLAPGTEPRFLLVSGRALPAWGGHDYERVAEFDALGALRRGDVARWLRGEQRDPWGSDADERLVLLRARNP